MKKKFKIYLGNANRVHVTDVDMNAFVDFNTKTYS